MNEYMTDQEFADAMALVEYISNDKVIEELERLIEREKALLEKHTSEGDPDREIILYNITVLAAAAARIRMLNVIMDSATKLSDAEELGE